MATFNYKISEIESNSIQNGATYKDSDVNITEPFKVNSKFNPNRNSIELHVYGLDGELIDSVYDYEKQAYLQDSQTIIDGNATSLTINPEQDVIELGYETGDVNLLYNFLDDLFTEDKSKVEFFIEEISGDRTEVRLLTTDLEDSILLEKVKEIKSKLDSTSYLSDFRLNLGENNFAIGINIDAQSYREYQSVIVKLYEPLSQDINIKATLNIQEVISDSVAYNVDVEIVEDELTIPQIKGPNFNIEVEETSTLPTEYLSYEELFSYPVNNTYREVTALMKEKGMSLSIDYSDFSNFIHFSSADERLRNFQYKLNLIDTYQNNIDAINNATNTTGGITGSRDYYEGLINSIVENFDHYDRYLYFESSSYAWPKVDTVKPYTNLVGSATGSWFNNILGEAELFDNSNPHLLINTVPTYLKDDPANANYSVFIHMLAQHFDNMWIYSKAVTDKYDGDNRLEAGIPKDLVEDALRNFGLKLYTSNNSTQDLFKVFTGETYDTGSEVINQFYSASEQPTSEDLYRKEVYKRIYHNLPLLLKSKGTERGLRALLNSFGIPTLYSSGSHSGLTVKIAGGSNTVESINYGPAMNATSSLAKIRLDNTGSIVSGSTLSANTSIVKRDSTYTDDIHSVEIGYSPSDYVNEVIYNSLQGSGLNIDELIGDPGEASSTTYSSLFISASQVLNGNTKYNLQDFTRILKFYDNVVFKMVKDFIPARTNSSTGIIVKPHILERSKAKQVGLEAEQVEYLGEIEIASITGSHGESFNSGSEEYSTAYSESVMTPDGPTNIPYHTHEEAKYDGEFSGSYLEITDGELNRDNGYKYDEPVPFDFTKYIITDATDCVVVWGFYSSCDMTLLVEDSDCVSTPVDPCATAPTLTTPTPSATNPSSAGSSTGQISYTWTGGVSPYTYVFSKGGVILSNGTTYATNHIETGLTAGTYVFTITDDCGTSTSVTQSIYDPVAQPPAGSIQFGDHTLTVPGTVGTTIANFYTQSNPTNAIGMLKNLTGRSTVSENVWYPIIYSTGEVYRSYAPYDLDGTVSFTTTSQARYRFGGGSSWIVDMSNTAGVNNQPFAETGNLYYILNT